MSRHLPFVLVAFLIVCQMATPGVAVDLEQVLWRPSGPQGGSRLADPYLWPHRAAGVPIDPPLQADRWLAAVAPVTESHRPAPSPRVSLDYFRLRLRSAIRAALDMADRVARVVRRSLIEAQQYLHAILITLDLYPERAAAAPVGEPPPIYSPILDIPISATLLPANMRDPEPLWFNADLLSPIDGLMLAPQGMGQVHREAAAEPLRTSSSAPRGPLSFTEIFVQSTAIAFLAVLLLVPFGCAYAAGSLYGWARDGPPELG